MVGAAPEFKTTELQTLVRALRELQRAVRALKAENAELRAQLSRAAR